MSIPPFDRFGNYGSQKWGLRSPLTRSTGEEKAMDRELYIQAARSLDTGSLRSEKAINDQGLLICSLSSNDL